MKKRLIIIFTAALVVAGAVGGSVIAASSFSATKGGQLFERVAQELDIPASELRDAVATARENIRGARLQKFVEAGVITDTQRTELETWLDAKPVVQYTFSSDGERFNGFRGLSDEVAKDLGITRQELQQAWRGASFELWKEYRSMTPVERRLSRIDQALADASISESSATALRDWINAMPEWLNNNDTYKEVLGKGDYGKSKRYEFFNGGKRSGEKGRHQSKPEVTPDDGGA